MFSSALFGLSFSFLQRTDFSWKEGRSQALLSEGVLRVLSVFVERDCIPIEDASWTLYSRSTENLTEEICVIPDPWVLRMTRARRSQAELRQMSAERVMDTVTESAAVVMVDYCELKVGLISTLILK